MKAWYLDSGASQHMSPIRDWFVNYEELSSTIPVKTGKFIYAVGRGEINIYAYDGNGWQRNYLAGVLYVPELKFNLFSLSSALDKGLELSSDSQKCRLRKDGIVIAVGDRHENLYKMKFKLYPSELRNNGSEQVCVHVKENNQLEIWHQRLAHQNTTHVLKVLKKWGITATPKKDWFCEGCALGKMNRKPFQTSLSQTKKPGELIHMDLCGPMENQSIGNSKYFMLLKDDYSHYKFVYFIKEKNEVTEKFKSFLKRMETEERKITRLRTDNDLEFVNKEIQKNFKPTWNQARKECSLHTGTKRSN